MIDYDYKANKAKLCDSMGRRLTTGLFEELQREATVSPTVFKLSDWKAEYVAIADPTSYKAAMALIGDWDHWLLLASNPIFKEHLDAWKAEVETKLKSEAVQELRKQAKTPVGTSAAKYLAEKGYSRKEKKPKEAPAETDRSGEDAKRLGLKVVKA